MKNIRYLCAALLLGATLPHTKASADDGAGYELGVSANVGFMSQYIYRGIKQSDTAAMGGIDVEYGPLYAGTWLADVSDDGDSTMDKDSSIEYDLYAGLSYALGEAVTVGVGYTSYQYTEGFDSAYNETNLALGFASEDFPFTLDLEYSFGDHTNGGAASHESDADYTFAAATLGYKGLFLTYGGFSEDWGGHYVEVGYGTTIMEALDVGLGFVNPSSDLGADGTDLADGDDTRIYFTVSTTFDL